MAARSERPLDRDYLPKWFRDEDMLRRILQLRMSGASLSRIFKLCRISRSSYDGVRLCARAGTLEGNRQAAAAFVARFDAIPPPDQFGRRAKPFTTDEGKMLAASIGRWKITPQPDDLDDEEE